jgi:hypothetical protein
MRYLLEIVSNNALLYHSLCKNLKKKNYKSEFAIIGPKSNNKKLVNIFSEKNGVNFNIFEQSIFENISSSGISSLSNKNIKKILNSSESIDYEILYEFEKTLNYKSLWRLIASDRILGRSYLNHVYGYDFDFKHDQHIILKIIINKIKYFEYIFLKFKPNVFIPAVAMGSIDIFIFKFLCIKYNCKYAVHFDLRTKNYFSFTSDIQYNFPKIEKDVRLYSSDNTLNPFYKEAEKIFNEININKKNTYFNAVLTKKYLEQKKKSLIFFILKMIINLSRTLIVSKNFNLIRIFKELSKSFYIFNQRSWIPNIGKSMIGKSKYLYYPIHSVPEYSTSVMGTMWQDQIFVIESLAKSIPYDWIVYVKDHPGIINNRVRYKSFYKKIESIPNVFIAPINEKSDLIIDNAEMVAAVSGTSGWEAVLRNKPVITFIKTFYDCIGLSKQCGDLNDLSNDIYLEYNRIKNMPKNKMREKLIILLSAFINNGFISKNPHQLLLENGSRKQFTHAGEELYEALIKYLDI